MSKRNHEWRPKLYNEFTIPIPHLKFLKVPVEVPRCLSMFGNEGKQRPHQKVTCDSPRWRNFGKHSRGIIGPSLKVDFETFKVFRIEVTSTSIHRIAYSGYGNTLATPLPSAWRGCATTR